MKIWKWFWQRLIYTELSMPLISVTIIVVIGYFICFYLFAVPQPPTTAYTTRADCTLAAAIHDRDMRVLTDKIEAQGQLMEAYRHRLSLYDDLLPREITDQ